MRVCLINPPDPDPPPAYFGPPYGLSLLGGLLERAGHEVRGRDLSRWTREAALAALPRLLGRRAPQLVGISCQSSSRWSALALADEAKRLAPEAAVVVGGPFPTVAPEFVLERCRADFAAIGDGEETLLELAEGRAPAAVRGLAYRRDKAVRRSPVRGPFLDLDSLPFPAFHLFDAERELERLRRPSAEAMAAPLSAAGRRCVAVDSALMVLGSRGCVYRCVFCPMSHSRAPVRRHSPRYVADLVGHLHRVYGRRRLVFGDNYFTLDRDWAREVCARLAARRPRPDWICMTRPDAVDPDLLRRLARAGCREISYGLESGSPEVQRRTGKRMRLERVGPAFAATKAAGIAPVLMLMVGNPGESRETLRQTAAFCRPLEPDRVQVHPARVYPGTRLHDIADREGIIPEDFYDRDDPHAPPYTGEHSLPELARLQALLQPRTVYLAAGAGCVNGCCELHRPQRQVAAPRLQQLLALASLRADRTVLGGGEPFLRQDLHSLLEAGRRIQMHGLRFYTTARPLAGRDCRPLLRGDLARGIVVPLFSPKPAAHDRRAAVPGALLQTRLGMLRWRKADGLVQAWAHLDRDNVEDLPGWLDWLAESGATEAAFLYGGSPAGWGGLPWKELPKMSLAAQALQKALPRARRLGLSISVFGIPECLARAEDLPKEESCRPFDELLPASGEPLALGALRRRGLKAQMPVCRKCRRRELCEGAWKSYLEIHGDEEFRAIAA
ncbi:MAG: radical SAM protein [Elusimicrobia bacterium]|nr:radical SAM protein [Elusimicrobiota bacterium]